ncbi:peptidylprolyl isomerase [Dysosmobacter sp.]|uniref:peptidylprolyl isomerase n=1 Tax=Dysosmobacter sp. TaxID=2591382 RepID=UPI003A92F1D6
MSASREKKNRQDQVSSGWVDPKTAREAKQRKEEKRSNLLYGTIFVVFLLVAVAAIVWKSNIIQRTTTAVTINGEKYTAAEVSFYYQNAYQSFINNYYSYMSYIGIDTSSSLKDQTVSSMGAMFTGAEEGSTWYDYFLDQALESMADIQALNDAAEAEGFTWNDDMQASLDNNMEALATGASTYGYTESQYLTMIFGSTMTKSIYEEQTKWTLLANAYQTAYSDSLAYTEDDLEEAYEADRNSYDVVSAQYVRISGSVATTDEEGNEVEVTDEMKAAAMDTAKGYADQIYADWQAGGSLETLADECEGTATYTDTDSITYSTSVLNDWLFDDARQAGDSAVLEDETNSAYYVAVFESRGRNDYDTVDVRHILIQPEASELSSDDEGYEDDVAAKKAEALDKAEALLEEWKAGDATEDSFAELAKENSADGSASEGGLYTEVYKGQMVTEFNDWCFDPSRQPGDTGVVETSYGAHVMYFVGYDIPYWQVQVRDALKTEAVNEWYAEKTEGYTVEQGSGIQYVG